MCISVSPFYHLCKILPLNFKAINNLSCHYLANLLHINTHSKVFFHPAHPPNCSFDRCELENL